MRRSHQRPDPLQPPPRWGEGSLFRFPHAGTVFLYRPFARTFTRTPSAPLHDSADRRTLNKRISEEI
jgi:hypothetical protein